MKCDNFSAIKSKHNAIQCAFIIYIILDYMRSEECIDFTVMSVFLSVNIFEIIKCIKNASIFENGSSLNLNFIKLNLVCILRDKK